MRVCMVADGMAGLEVLRIHRLRRKVRLVRQLVTVCRGQEECGLDAVLIEQFQEILALIVRSVIKSYIAYLLIALAGLYVLLRLSSQFEHLGGQLLSLSLHALHLFELLSQVSVLLLCRFISGIRRLILRPRSRVCLEYPAVFRHDEYSCDKRDAYKRSQYLEHRVTYSYSASLSFILCHESLLAFTSS